MEDPRKSDVERETENEAPKPEPDESAEDREISDEELDRASGGMF